MKNKNLQSGRSMVEMLGVLAIIGVLSVGAMRGYNLALEKHKVNKTVEAFFLVLTEIEVFMNNTDQNFSYSKIGKFSTDSTRNEYFNYDENSISANILKNVMSTPYTIHIYGYSNMVVVSVPNMLSGSDTEDIEVCKALMRIDWEKIYPYSRAVLQTVEQCESPNNYFILNVYDPKR